MKLPEKKYEPKHNDKLRSYAVGWNSIIEETECLYDLIGEERTKEDLLATKEYISKMEETPFFKGVYDCIVEIERLNEEVKAEHRLDNFFQDSLEALDKLNIRGESKKAVLVIDTTNCGGCPFCRNGGYYSWCSAPRKERSYEMPLTIKDIEEKRTVECPLTKLPPRQSTYGTGCPYSDDYMRGFNTCLEEILKGK